MNSIEAGVHSRRPGCATAIGWWLIINGGFLSLLMILGVAMGWGTFDLTTAMFVGLGAVVVVLAIGVLRLKSWARVGVMSAVLLSWLMIPIAAITGPSDRFVANVAISLIVGGAILLWLWRNGRHFSR